MAAVIVVVLGLTAMWVYAFSLTGQDNPDVFPDRAWAANAESVCATYTARVDALPPARSFKDIQPRSEALRQRADVGTEATDLLREMVAELAGREPADEKSRTGVNLWLQDWGRYLADRDRHVAGWRAGNDEPFSETAVSGEDVGKGVPVSIRIDAFAKANRMASCVVPQDFG